MRGTSRPSQDEDLDPRPSRTHPEQAGDHLSMRVVGEGHSGHPRRERLPLAAARSLLADEHKRHAGTAAALSGLSTVKGGGRQGDLISGTGSAPPLLRPVA